MSLAGDAFSLDSVSKATGVAVGDIVAAAYLYATGGSSEGPDNLPHLTHPSNLPIPVEWRWRHRARASQTTQMLSRTPT